MSNTFHTRRPLLEIVANSLDSALAAQSGGADRIELCSALELGGLTPSYGLLRHVRERLSIPVFVLIRPRAGDFLYSPAELETMRADIAHCAAMGADGVVLGVLDADGHVDAGACTALMSAAHGLEVTFHRAIDVCSDPAMALEQIIHLGCTRVLSSGGAPSAVQGAAALRALVTQAAGRIVVMPGAGIAPDNIDVVRMTTGAAEFHASAKRQWPSAMRHVSADPLGMGDGPCTADETTVRALRMALDQLSQQKIDR